MSQTPWGFKPEVEKRRVYRDEKGRYIEAAVAKRKGIAPKTVTVRRGPGRRFISKEEADEIDLLRKKRRKAGIRVQFPRSRKRKPKPPPEDIPVKVHGNLWRYKGKFMSHEDAVALIERRYRETAEEAPVRVPEPEPAAKTLFDSGKIDRMVDFDSVRTVLEDIGFLDTVERLRNIRESRYTVTIDMSCDLFVSGQGEPQRFRRQHKLVIVKPTYKVVPWEKRKTMFQKVYEYGIPSADVYTATLYAIWIVLRQLIQDVTDHLGESPSIQNVRKGGYSLNFYMDSIRLDHRKA